MKRAYNTKQREVILLAIKKQTKGFLVKDLYEQLGGKIGLSTIYRMVDALANDLVDFAVELDPYDYLDSNHDRETALKEMKEHLLAHAPDSMIAEIQDIIREHDDESITEKGSKLIRNLDQMKEKMEDKTHVKPREEEAEAR